MDMRKYEEYFIYDSPVPYKNIFIYPANMRNYLNFHIAVNCLVLEKNKIPDPKIISMSYLDFLFYKIEEDNNKKDDKEKSYYALMFVELMSICLNISSEDIEYKYDDKGKIQLILSKTTFDKNDFNEMKNIILYQNIPDYDDTYIDPKVKAILDEAEEFTNRNKKKMASLEDQLVCVLISTSLKLEDIYNLSIRKFSKILQRVDYKLHYEIYKQAEMSGMVTFKEDISHWMSELSKNKYSDIIVDYGEFKGKMQGIT